MPNKEIKFLIPQAIGLFVVVATLLISIGGKEIPIGTNVSKKVGRFSVRTYKYGLFLNQPPARVFYNFSPYESFYTNDAGDNIRLLFWENVIVSDELSKPIGSFESRLTALLSVFNQIQPKATFKTTDGNLVFASESTRNKLRVFIEESPYEGWGETTTLTMTIDEDDFIFTEQGELLSRKDEDEVTEFEKFFKYPLKPVNIETEEFDDKLGETVLIDKTPSQDQLIVKEALYIINPKTEGIVKIKQEFNQDAVIIVNLENDTIEFVQPSWKKAEAVIELFDSMQEALQK